jgi:hypothetical protein
MGPRPKSDSRDRRTRRLIVHALLAVGLGACGGGGGGGGGGGSITPSTSGGGSWDPDLGGQGGVDADWAIGPELDFYPPALQKTFSLENSGSDPLPWNVQLTASWMQGSGPSSGTLEPGESVDVPVDVDPWAADSSGGEIPLAQVVFRNPDTAAVLSDYDVKVDAAFKIDDSFATGGSNGWTAFTPSADTTVVYVSSSMGNDANDGLSASTPKRTIAAGKELLTHGKPDWMLLLRGDTWDEGLGQWAKSGRSPAEPMVVASYGASISRPLLRTGAGDGVTTTGGGGAPPTTENVAFLGLHFWANGYDGGGNACAGARILQTAKHMLFEDCEFQAYHTNLILQGFGGTHEDLRVRRCIIVDAYAKHSAFNGHPQGLYAHNVDGLLIEENLFDHNGWNAAVPDAGPDMFCHNLYINNGNFNVTVRGNIIANASSHGMQLRCGGEAMNNLFVHNAIALSLGGGNNPEPGGVSALALGNVILEGKDIDPSLPRGWGLWFGNIAEGQASYNVVANNTEGSAPLALLLAGDDQGDTGFGAGVNNLQVDHNVFRNWGGNIRIDGGSWQVTNVDIFDLDVQDMTHAGPLVDHSTLGNSDNVDAGFNRFYSKLTPGTAWTKFQLVDHTIDYWKSQVGDTTSDDVLVSYANPSVSVASYNAVIGGPASLSAFLVEARKQSKTYWRREYQASCVNRYVRAGFKSF